MPSGPLRTLLAANPGLVDDLLALAMVLGIHAAEKKRRHDAAFAQVQSDLQFGLRHYGIDLKSDV